MSEITSEHLTDKDNHVECQCGNITTFEYGWTNIEGEWSCPLCMVDWLGSQVKAMKQLLYALSPKSKEETALEINKKYAEIMTIDVEDFDEDMDFSKP